MKHDDDAPPVVQPPSSATVAMVEPVIEVSNFVILKVRPMEPFMVVVSPELDHAILRLTFDKAAE